MRCEGTVELVIHVPIYVSADSIDDADEQIDAYMNTKNFRDYCKKQLTKGKNSYCVIQPYNLHNTKELVSKDDMALYYGNEWPLLWSGKIVWGGKIWSR